MILFGLFFGVLGGASLYVSRAELDGITPGTGWDFTGDGQVSASDILLYLRYNLCTPVHLAIKLVPDLQSTLKVPTARPFNGMTELAGAAAWIVTLILCARLGGAIGRRLGQPDPYRSAAQAALRHAKQSERRGRR
ncbi:hypothetical protein [Muricoccus radiodurans]|uniref:hypothetical protein n=1 Tax=Muricoccus radiodurans TaxID=2231721 RepID=UPI003CE8D6C3